MLNSKFRNLINRLMAGYAHRLGFSSARPENIILNLTNRCNLHCQHCDIWQEKNHHQELKTEEWFKIIDNLSDWTIFPEITLNGGEIFLRADIFPLIERLQNNGFKKITLNTNGTLINQAIAPKLVENNLFKIELSLYSLQAEVHDSLRGLAGSWQKTSNALEQLLKDKKEQSQDFLLLVAFLVTEKNYQEIPAMVAWASQRGVWVSLQALDANFHLPGVMTGGGMWHQDNLLWPKNFADFRKIWQKVIGMKRQRKNIYNRLEQLRLMEKYYKNPFSLNHLECLAGQRNFIVNSDGQVFLCFRRGAVGSLLQQKPQEIWWGAEAKIRRDEMKQCLLTCRVMNCNYKASVI